MPWTTHILVVANQTAGCQELVEALLARNDRGHLVSTLVMPMGIGLGREPARRRLEAALERLRAAGLQVEGRVGSADPVVATMETWDPVQFDEIVVATLPAQVSKWLEVGLPRRIERRTGALVEHVEGTRDWLSGFDGAEDGTSAEPAPAAAHH